MARGRKKKSLPNDRWRSLNGIVLIDKPAGQTSNLVLQRTRRLFWAEKGGHTGSLDPLATGMLPMCFGEATKVAGLMLGEHKNYVAQCTLGSITETGDSDGEVISTFAVPVLSEALIESVLAHFRGEIMQRPPAYSAIKKDGVAMYKLAREGRAPQLPERPAMIFALRLIGFSATTIEIEVECGSGTYIRSISQDIGEKLGCGAHISDLRRTWVSPFEGQRMWTLQELEAMTETERMACVLPVDAGLGALPRLDVDEIAAERFLKGSPLDIQLDEYAGFYRVYQQKLGFLGLGNYREDRGFKTKRIIRT